MSNVNSQPAAVQLLLLILILWRRHKPKAFDHFAVLLLFVFFFVHHKTSISPRSAPPPPPKMLAFFLLLLLLSLATGSRDPRLPGLAPLVFFPVSDFTCTSTVPPTSQAIRVVGPVLRDDR